MKNEKVLVLKAKGKARMVLDVETQKVYIPLVSDIDELPEFFYGTDLFRGTPKLDIDQKIWVLADKVIDYILQEGEGDPELNIVIKGILKEKNIMMEQWEKRKKELENEDTH